MKTQMSRECRIFNTVYDHRKWLTESNLFVPEANFTSDLALSMSRFDGILVGLSGGHAMSLSMGGVMTSLCTADDYERFTELLNKLRPGCFYFYFDQSVDGWEGLTIDE